MYFKLNKKIFVHKSFVLLPFAVFLSGLADFYLKMIIFALLHEAAHGSVAAILGNKTEKLYISPYGCELRLACASPSREALILISGPVFSLTLAAVGCFLKNADFFRANAVLFALNMLPAYPLDGGKILKIALWRMWGVWRGNKILRKISYTAAVCLFCAALPLRSAWLAVIGCLIFSRTKSLKGTPFYRKRKSPAPVKAFRADEPITVLDALRLFSPYYYTCIFVESKEKLLTEREIIDIAREGDYKKIL